jgi:hypothetical protein
MDLAAVHRPHVNARDRTAGHRTLFASERRNGRNVCAPIWDNEIKTVTAMMFRAVISLAEHAAGHTCR